MAEDVKLVPVEQRTVAFYDDELVAVLADNGQVYVPLRPISDYLGLSWSGQYERINRDPVLSDEVRSVRVTRTQDQPRDMTCLPLDYLNGWLFGINANRVRKEIKDRLIRYQRECYRILASAFRPLPSESAGLATLEQVRDMGLAIATLAQEQMEFEQRVENRLDQAVLVVSDLGQRVTSLEERIAPGEAVTDEQASQISQAVKTVALVMTKQSGSSQYGAVYGELYRKFGITSYKMLPTKRFEEAMKFLTDWHGSLVGDSPF